MRVNMQAAHFALWSLFALLVFGLVRILYLAFVVPTTTNQLAEFLAAILSMFALIYVIGKMMDKEGDDLWNNHKGLRSEKTVLIELKDLPNEYHIFRNVEPGRRYDVDFVVVGPRGIFVLEVNSVKGEVYAVGEKLYRSGRPLVGKDRIKQTLRNTIEISDYLDKKYFVQGAVVFGHYRAKTRLGFNKIGGVHVIKHLWVNKFIMEESDDQRLTPEAQEHIREKLLLVTRI